MAKPTECTFNEPFKSNMQELLKTCTNYPTRVSMSEWYYMQDHVQECEFCFERFERLVQEARKGRRIDGPTTLGKG